MFATEKTSLYVTISFGGSASRLRLRTQTVAEIFGVDHMEWPKELAAHKEFFDSLGGVVPEELCEQGERLAARFKQ